MGKKRPTLPREQDPVENGEAKDPDEIPDVDELDDAEKIGENRYVISTGDSNNSE